MALQNVNEVKFTKVTELEVGGQLSGYLLDVKDSSYEGRFNLIMEIDGKPATVPAVGNLHYLVADKKLTPGLFTVITREEDKKVKGGKKATQVMVQQDPELTKTGFTTTTTSIAAAPNGMSAKIASLKG